MTVLEVLQSTDPSNFILVLIFWEDANRQHILR